VCLLARRAWERETTRTNLAALPCSSFFFAAGGSDPPEKGPIQTPGEGEDVELEDKPVSSIPRRYKVIFHNDDYTTQEFVVFVLERFFHKSETEARHIMLTVHHKGAAVAGVYTKDVAETKAQQVMDAARENGMPLLLTTEPE
jgi:ATP-dependent Clp protease adaptor protein ClpS